MIGKSSVYTMVLLILLAFYCSPLSSQQMQYGCDLDVICHNYFGTSHFGEFVADPPGSNCNEGALCGTQPLIDIPPIYPFYALDESISITVNANGGIYFSIVKPGQFQDCIVAGWDCEDDNSSVETGDLIIGELYYIVFSQCGEPPTVLATEFELIIDNQEFDEVELVIGLEVSLIEECSAPFNSEHSYCPGTGFRIHPIINPEISTDIFEGSQWVLEINPEGLGDIIQVNYPFEYFEYYSEYIGLHSVELIGISGMELCTELGFTYRTLLEHAFIVGEEEFVDLGEFSICETNLQFGFTPPHPWSGEDIFEEGIYYNTGSNECACEELQKLTVIQIDLTPGEMNLELCPQDLPYQLNDDIIINAGDDLNGNYYEIEGGSLQEDYNQEYCDSLFQLFVTYVDDQEVCNQCELAYSVKLDNLVACIPFDNSELDVSLHENHSELQNGAQFFEDRFGNPDFATNLDGIDDYIKIDHTEAFLDDQFSFSFWFKKSENTFNTQNSKEALIYKGLEGSSNKTFSITLEEHFADKMLLDFRLNSGSYEKHIQYGALDYDRWYHVAIINDFGNLKLILDGKVVESNNSNVNIRFNGEDIILGAIPSSTGFSGFFKGQIDEFRFWRRSLSDWEGHLLYKPEDDFHVTTEYYLNCCETVSFYGNEYDINTNTDSIRIKGVSPIGTDSVFVINIYPMDSPPEIDQGLMPDDIEVFIVADCDAPCEAVVEWNNPPDAAFTDNCSHVTITQSHQSPLLVSQDQEYIEVVYTATDDCGQKSTASFMITLSCTNTSSPDIPEPELLTPLASNICIGQETSVCPGTHISWNLLHHNTNEVPSSYPHNFTADWQYILTGPFMHDTLNFNDAVSPEVMVYAEHEGAYTLCLQSISNLCHTVEKEVCHTILAIAGQDIDHGTINMCMDEIEDITYSYPSLSQGIISEITLSPDNGQYSYPHRNACNCPYTEYVELNIINTYPPKDIFLKLCEEDLPYDFHGISIETGNEYFFQEVVLPELTTIPNEDGLSCDSTVILTTLVHSSIENIPIQVEICEGEEFEGYTEAGTYEIMNTNVLGCDSLTTIVITLLPEDDPNCQSVSTFNLEQNEVVAYPIPSSDIIYVESDFLNEKKSGYFLLNTNGKCIQHGYISRVENLIDVKDLANGIYILQLKTDDAERSIKVVVMK